MKRFFLAALAIAAIASCTKNEVNEVADNSQITFQTVVGPQTKALDPLTQVAFSTSNKFYAYAFFLPQGNSWATNYASSQKYIYNSLVGYSDNVWKASQTYYWPKQGNLTFFAWTDNTTAPAVNGSTTAILCAHDTGIQVLDYSVTDNPNKDLMVAAIAADKTKNENTYLTDGVPTLFSHVLSNVVFKVTTDEDYGTSAALALKSITLKNVYVDGDYTQGSPAANATVWNGYANTGNLPVYTPATATAVTYSTTPAALTPDTDDYYIVMPQTFADATPVVEVVYTITTNYTTTPVVETVTETKALKDIYTNGWVPGKKYELTITLTLDEILWDPAVVEWVTDSTPATTI